MRWLSSALLLAVSPVTAAAGALTVAWNASPDTVSGYNVYYRPEGGSQVSHMSVGATSTWAVLGGLPTGQRYVVWVTAVSNGVESAPSASVTGAAADTVAMPPGAVRTYFAEGAAGFFAYRLALLNTTSGSSTVGITYLREGGAPIARSYVLGPSARLTVSASDVPELSDTSFAAIVTSMPGVVAERTMRWRMNGGDGAHSAKALVQPATRWYLAEGNAGYFDTFVLIGNPGTTTANVTVDFLLDGGGVVRRTYSLAASQRYTIWTNQIPQLASRSFATTVSASVPVLVERSMYFNGPHGAWEGGHASAAVSAPARNWFLAEGSTGNWFETFVLLSNPNASAVTATIQYLTPSGVARTETRTLPAQSRTTIAVDTLPGLGNTDVSCSIAASGNIIVERSMYWPGLPGPWYGAHNSVGVTTLGTQWALAEGEVGGQDGANTFVLLANPGSAAASVTLTFYRTSGDPVQVTRTVAARSRLTVSAAAVGLGSGEQFGVTVTSSQPIAVERSIYWNHGGSLWTSGTNETAVAIQ
jgi:hypothetical protein